VPDTKLDPIAALRIRIISYVVKIVAEGRLVAIDALCSLMVP
jgi:hypothetical protein